MTRPKQITLSPYSGSGVQVTYTKRRGMFDFFVYYEGVGFQPDEVSLRDFLTGLGITAQECAKALEEAA